MNRMRNVLLGRRMIYFAIAPLCLAGILGQANAQPDRRLSLGDPEDEQQSPEVLPDRPIVFRIHALETKAVTLGAGDLLAAEMTPGTSTAPAGAQAALIGSEPSPMVESGAYRSTFTVDGVRTLDPRNRAFGASFLQDWTLVLVPGSSISDLRDVPHGSVVSVVYSSSSRFEMEKL